MSQTTFITLLLFLTTFLLTTIQLPALPDPDPATIQTQTQTLNPPAQQSPIATIPAFPEQSETSGCPLDLPNDLFHGIKSACGSKPHHLPDPDSHSGRVHRTRCCPVLAAYLYSAYSKTALQLAGRPPVMQTTSYDMPVLPGDSETCVDTLDKALGSKGIVLSKPNETCDVVYCYCGIRLHPFSCPEAFGVNSRGKVVGNAAVRKLEKDCANSGGYGGCSKCLGSLHLLNEDKGGRTNKSERKSKMHNEDCDLMGLTWLLNKNRSTYIHTVSAVLRALMTKEESSGPAVCSLNGDGMPLAVDSSEIDSQSSSAFLAMELHQLLVPLSLCMLFMSSVYFSL